jgi:broad specificity phosphatase PhoE
MKVELIIFRHGETDWNRERRAMGTTDIPLNAVGKQQAEILAARLARERIDALYTSQLTRAKETMDAVARHHRLPVIILDDLREMNLGLFEGKLKADRALLFPEFDAGNDEHRLRMRMDTFSHWVSALRTQTLPNLMQRHDGQTIALSTHDQKMRALLIALGMPDETKRTVLKNCAMTKISIKDGDITVLLHNDTSHLNTGNVLEKKL